MGVSVAVLEALAVTAELTGTQISAAGAKVMADDLAPYPEHQVLVALSRCRKELKGRLTIADIVCRLEDGRPSPEEAWAMLPMDEQQTIVWTEEMAGAFFIALPLLEEGDRIAARMAFLEGYRSRMQKVRDAGIPVQWSVSFGQNPHGRQAAVEQALWLGRIGNERAAQLGFEILQPSEEGLARLASVLKQLPRA